MDDYRIDHTPRELLDRIIRLERENERLRESLSFTNKTLKELQYAFKQEEADVTLNIKKIYQRFDVYSDVIWPTVYKVFPNLARDQKQFDAIIKEQPRQPKK